MALTAPDRPPDRPVVHLRTWRCAKCTRVLFEHARPLEAIAEAAGLLRLKCGNCNRMNELACPD